VTEIKRQDIEYAIRSFVEEKHPETAGIILTYIAQKEAECAELKDAYAKVVSVLACIAEAPEPQDGDDYIVRGVRNMAYWIRCQKAENEGLRERVKTLENEINTFNERMKQLPYLEKKPRTPEEAFEHIATWMDALYQEVDGEVQHDLREFANDVRRMRKSNLDKGDSIRSFWETIRNFYDAIKQAALAGKEK
jgi:cell division protein FtsB